MRHLRWTTFFASTLAAACAVEPERGPAHERPAPEAPPRLEDDGDRGPARDAACPDDVPFTASVRARVVDEAGAGLADVRVQLCVWTFDARMLCLEPGRADATGEVVVEVAEPARCMVGAIARVLLPQSRRPALYCPLDLPLDDASVTVPDPYLLIEAAAPIALPALGDENAARTVTFADLDVEVTPAAIGAEAYARLAVTTLAPEAAPACVTARAPALDLLVAFSPEVDVAGAGFPLTIANTLGAEAGEELRVLQQGSLDCHLEDGTAIEKGAWRELGTAIVSEDGERIVASGAAAAPCLGWLGLRR